MEYMNTKIGRKWVKALRSGKYKQAKGSLMVPSTVRDEDGKEVNYDRHCCLGVLCEIMGTPFDSSQAFIPNGLEAASNLPRSIQEALAARNDGNSCHVDNEPKLDWVVNKTMTFKGIATFIEKNLLPPIKTKGVNKKK